MLDRPASWVLAIAVCAAGCGTSLQYAETNRPPHPMRPRIAASVEVFSSKLPEQPYVEVGIIEAHHQSNWADDMPDMFAKLREFAGEHGCDGVIMTGSNNAIIGGDKSPVATLKGYRATCIVFLPPSAPARDRAAPVVAPAPPA